MIQVTLLYLFYRWLYWNTERESNFLRSEFCMRKSRIREKVYGSRLLAEIMLLNFHKQDLQSYVHRKTNATSFFMILLKTIPSYFYSYNISYSYNVLSCSLLKWEGLSLIFWTFFGIFLFMWFCPHYLSYLFLCNKLLSNFSDYNTAIWLYSVCQRAACLWIMWSPLGQLRLQVTSKRMVS